MECLISKGHFNHFQFMKVYLLQTSAGELVNCPSAHPHCSPPSSPPPPPSASLGQPRISQYLKNNKPIYVFFSYLHNYSCSLLSLAISKLFKFIFEILVNGTDHHIAGHGYRVDRFGTVNFYNKCVNYVFSCFLELPFVLDNDKGCAGE